jgi:YGGT family.
VNEWPLMNGLASIVAGMAVLRYLLEGVQVSRHNPLMKMAVVSSEFALQWIRPLISSLPGRDRSALFWAWLVNFVMAMSQLSWRAFVSRDEAVWHLLPWGMALAVVDVIQQMLYVWMAAVFLMALLSWVNPFSPLLVGVEALVRPFLEVLRRFIPPLGRIDLTPVILMIFFQFTLTVGIGALEMLVQRLM